MPNAKRASGITGIMNKSFAKLIGSAALAASLVACTSSNGEKRTAGEVFDDTAVLAKTKAALVEDPDIRGSKIDVDVSHGEVTLTGTVRSEEERKKVLATVWGIKGVKGVQTDLKVQPPNP